MRPPEKPTQADQLFVALWRDAPKAQPRKARQKDWISVKTWILVNDIVSALRDPQYRREFKRQLWRAVKTSLVADWKRRADEAEA